MAADTTPVLEGIIAAQWTTKRFETANGFSGPIRPGDTTMEITDVYEGEITLRKPSSVRVEAENPKEDDPRIERVRFVSDDLPDGIEHLSFKPKVTEDVREEHGAVEVESEEKKPAPLSNSQLNAVRKARELLLDGKDVVLSAEIREGRGETDDGEEYRFAFISADMADTVTVAPLDDGDGD